MSRDASGAEARRPIFTRYSGVTDSEIVSPIASWKPSFALPRRMTGCFHVRALVEVVPQLVVDGGGVLGRRVDAHLDAHVGFEVEIPGAGMADDVAILRPDKQRPFPERLRQGIEAERRVEALADADHVEGAHFALLQDVVEGVARIARCPGCRT